MADGKLHGRHLIGAKAGRLVGWPAEGDILAADVGEECPAGEADGQRFIRGLVHDDDARAAHAEGAVGGADGGMVLHLGLVNGDIGRRVDVVADAAAGRGGEGVVVPYSNPFCCEYRRVLPLLSIPPLKGDRKSRPIRINLRRSPSNP